MRKPKVVARDLTYLAALHLTEELRYTSPDLRFTFKPQGNAGFYQVEVHRDI
jgi:hypothetical protein